MFACIGSYRSLSGDSKASTAGCIGGYRSRVDWVDQVDASRNPFNAGFGVTPPFLAGRAGLLHRVLANLHDGPGRAAYLSVLLGGRGVGKTVMLNEIRDHVTDEFGWATIRWTAGPDVPIGTVVADAFDDTIRALRGRRSRVTGGSAGINLGVVRGEVEVAQDQTRPSTLSAQLRGLGQIAASVNRQVVLLVDELQACDPSSLRLLSVALQETNGERLPVGLVAAGLPSTSARLRSIAGATFLERQRTLPVSNLSLADAREALETPIRESGRAYDDGIFEAMLAVSGGYPYAIQLVGEATWDAAGGRGRITTAHARRGAARARAELDALYGGRWAQLGDQQRRYLVAVVTLLGVDGTALSNAVAAALGRETTEVSWLRDSLIKDHQLLYADGRNALRVALPGFDVWLRRKLSDPGGPVGGLL